MSFIKLFNDFSKSDNFFNYNNCYFYKWSKLTQYNKKSSFNICAIVGPKN